MKSDDQERDKPTRDEYENWYEEQGFADLNGGLVEKWYIDQRDRAATKIGNSAFWNEFLENLSDWDAEFTGRHPEYPLLENVEQSKGDLREIEMKGFKSVVDKSYRWNIRQNESFRDPPSDKPPSTAPKRQEDLGAEKEECWFGPHNWFRDFPDIFRTRIVVTYFDGVNFLAEKMLALAKRTTSRSAIHRPRGGHDGYHAVHVGTYHELDMESYERGNLESIALQLEIQITTTIQATINSLLHKVYERDRSDEDAKDWEWDKDHPVFSVNYLGSTLHYLDGMIVNARENLKQGGY